MTIPSAGLFGAAVIMYVYRVVRIRRANRQHQPPEPQLYPSPSQTLSNSKVEQLLQ